MPEGIENLQNENDIAAALSQLKKNNPALQKAVVKMNDGFSGEGNAIFYYKDLDAKYEDLGKIGLVITLFIEKSDAGKQIIRQAGYYPLKK